VHRQGLLPAPQIETNHAHRGDPPLGEAVITAEADLPAEVEDESEK